MTFLQRVSCLLVTKDIELELTVYYDYLKNPGDAAYVYAHYELARIFRRAAAIRPMFSAIYRRLSLHHRDEALRKDSPWPGPMGMLADDELSEGDFWDAIKHLEEEIERLRIFLKASVTANDDDRIMLSNLYKMGAIAFTEIGDFSQARDWVDKSLAEFEVLPPDLKQSHPEIEESIVLCKASILQMKGEYQAALDFINSALREDSRFSSNAQESLKAARVVLTGYIPLVEGYVPINTEKLLVEMISKVQRSDTHEALGKARRDIMSAVERKAVQLGLQRMADATIAGIETQIIRARQLQIKVSPPPSVKFVSEEQFAAIKDPEAQRRAREMQEALKKTLAQSEDIANSVDQLSKAFSEATIRISEGSISRVKDIAKSSYSVPLSFHVRWFWLTVARYAIQLFAVVFLIESVLERILKARVGNLFERVKSSQKELIIDVVVALLIFIVGKVAEERIDRATVKKCKSELIRLVMAQARMLWTGYNNLVIVARSVNEKLANL